MVSIDAAVLDEAFFVAIREGAAQETGLAPESIIVCATHTHSAPCTQKVWGWSEIDVEYVENIMIPGAVKAIREAANSLVPARIGIGVTQSAVGINRRPLTRKHQAALGQYEQGLYDPR